MKTRGTREPIILGLAPFARGVGFAVFSGPWLPIDWGIKWAKTDKNEHGVQHARELIEQYAPDTVVMEDTGAEGARRWKRIRALITAIERTAGKSETDVARYSRGEIRELFSELGAVTKYEIAKVIAKDYPDFAPRLPEPRKIWLAEDPNMAIFEAASLALVHFARKSGGRNRGPVRSWLARIGQHVVGM